MDTGMDTVQAARRWARTWEQAWREHDAPAIAALYRRDAQYRSSPFRDPEEGGALGYVMRAFVGESGVVCRFGPPMVDGRRAAVEWWAALDEDGAGTTLAGTTVLTFDEDGLVVDHVDYWRHAEQRMPPYPGWAAGAGTLF
jgi:hypothetical protein